MISSILDELGIKPILSSLPKENVTSHIRTDGENNYLFVENYGERAVENLSLDGEYINMVTGEKVSAVSLVPYSIVILKNRNEKMEVL